MKRKLEELNLIDDFLMNQMVADPTYGQKFSHMLLETLLQREVGKLTVTPQKVFYGTDTDKHGIRLDVYLDEKDKGIVDIEPDRNDSKKEIASLPRRARFYHSKIDADVLYSGQEYEALRDVVVIFITDYDPFGYDRMLYTVRRKCEEEPDMTFNDGSTTLFFYTHGKKTDYVRQEVTEEIRELLGYIEHSDTAHAGTGALKEIQKMVEHVKQDAEVGKAYMKFSEIIRRERREGREEGRTEGEYRKLISLVHKKVQKEKPLEQVADELEEDVEAIRPIYDAVMEMVPDFDADVIYEKLYSAEIESVS